MVFRPFAFWATPSFTEGYNDWQAKHHFDHSNNDTGHTMNKAELIDAIADKTGQTRADTTNALDALLETIEATVAKGDKVLLVGFGTFEPHHRNARPGRNPQTGEPIEIAEATLPKFTPGKSFKERVVEAHKPKPKPKATAKAKAKPKKV